MKMRVSVWLMALSLGPAATAGSLHVKPTTVILPPGQAAATVTVTNTGDAPLNAQIRVFEWTQSENKDDLNPTQALVASPPAATLAPSASQVIRLVRVDKSKVAHEESYRLLADEIIDPATAPTVGVAIRMRYSIPVFVTPANAKPAKVTVTAQLAGHSLTLNADNKGGTHAQAANVSVEYSDGTSTPVVKGLLGYVLPGKTMLWTLDLPENAGATGHPVRMHAYFNDQELQVDL